ncbi:MAG: YHS domain-containing protein [Gammaproteobacteria bacterium]|nr:YHS domain-containing protein [Gammaproteobacteria bacterium]
MTILDKKQMEDLVCHMVVDDDSHAIEYKGHAYAFCSRQCRDRFEANPLLYVGGYNDSSLEHAGHATLKKRVLKLKAALSVDQSAVIVAALEAMMGIEAVVVETDRIVITYDLLQATVEQIEATIENSGETLGGGLAAELKRAFIHYIEETELDNLEQQQASAKPGCH